MDNYLTLGMECILVLTMIIVAVVDVLAYLILYVWLLSPLAKLFV